MATAGSIRDLVAAAPIESFVAVRELPGSERAVESAVSRLAAAGNLIRVRHGLYWKGYQTRFGMSPPGVQQLGMRVAGPGSGPAGLSAVRTFGLSTQVPAIEEIAVAGRAPEPVPGVRFVARSFARRLHHLQPVEVALLEVLRDWPEFTEGSWKDLVASVRGMVSEGKIRPRTLSIAVGDESSRNLRKLWSDLEAVLT